MIKSTRNVKNVRRPAVPNSQKDKIKDPIQVFCRIRPLLNENEISCIKKKENENIVIMSPPDSLLSLRGAKEVHYSFKYVFDEQTSQKAIFDHVAMPMISDLFQGINGLLFTYGITSSGKTFTITGTPQNQGILPRSLDVILNTIKRCQAEKFLFKSDKFNGFDIQSFEDIQNLQRTENISKNRQRKKDYLGEWANRVTETSAVEDANVDYRYAVFISYVEIYNNYIYDLLEEPASSADSYPKQKLQSKILREDINKVPYVFNANEVEVQTADEALELFCKGQLTRRISETLLNAKSSRSHSVFTVRIVKAPLNSQGSDVLRDQSETVISQLSIVDLAGSERMERTGNKGRRQLEAGNINTSLMALRKCMEVLRENQKLPNQTKMVPYRESKLTQLFKIFFEGEGAIRMIVCANPHVDDYAETTHVMQFAEVSQEVLIQRGFTPVSTRTNYLKSGRGQRFLDAVRKAREEGVPLDTVSEPVSYTLGPEFPAFMLEAPYGEDKLSNLIEFLNARKSRRECLTQDLIQKQNDFRRELINIEKRNVSLKQENVTLQMDLNAREQQVRDLQNKLDRSDNERHLLAQRLSTTESQKEALKNKMQDQEQKLNNETRIKDKYKKEMHDRIRQERLYHRQLLEKVVAEKEAEFAGKSLNTKEIFDHIRHIINVADIGGGGDGFHLPQTVSTQSRSRLPSDRVLTRARTTIDHEDVKAHKKAKSSSVSTQVKASSIPEISSETSTPETFKTPLKSVPVANPRHRRSHSSTDNVWLEHKPVGNLRLGTVLQPKMKKKKSVSKLEVKDVTNNDVSKYVLEHQEQDSQGELETKLYKGDVIPSAGGGAQVIFSDIEKLKQESPPQPYNLRKRSAENVPLKDIEANCAMSVECHGVPSKIQRK